MILEYSGVLETIYNDKLIHKYKLTEFGESYTLLFDVERNYVFINEYQLSFEEYLDLIQMQTINLKSKLLTGSLNVLKLTESFPKNEGALLKYEEKHLDYVENVKKHFHDTNFKFSMYYVFTKYYCCSNN